MTSIKFITNLPVNQNNQTSWQFNETDFLNIPTTPGVYIIGVKIPVQEQGEKFCPLIVGESLNLKKRITGHWDKNSIDTRYGELNSYKELFDLDESIKKVYEDMCLYDKYPSGGSYKKHKKYVEIKNKNNSLIYFSCKSFFDFYLNLEIGTSNFPLKKGRHDNSISDLNKIISSNSKIISNKAKILLNKINKTKGIIENKYWFAYCTQNEIIYENANNEIDFNEKDSREFVEHSTKDLLIKLNIYTTAKSQIIGKFKKGYIPLNIDLSAIKMDLVNLKN